MLRRSSHPATLPGFRETESGPFDQVSRDGSLALDFRLSRIMGSRDLHAAMVEMALAVQEDKRIQRAFLVWHSDRLTWARARREWNRVACLLPERLRKRLAFVRFVEGSPIECEPPHLKTHHVVRKLEETGLPEQDRELPSSAGLSPGLFEVLKVLLLRWLRGSGPVATGKLMETCSLSHPTVAGAIEELTRRRELRRLRNRSVELVAFPRQTWQQVVTISDQLRKPIRFVSAAGRPPEPEFHLKLLREARLGGVAIGGVVAARRMSPDFDLVGTPRLDITMASTGIGIHDLLSRVDPTLQISQDPSAECAIVVHRLRRAENLFQPGRAGDLQSADEVEVLLDLHELRLEQQAADLVEHLIRRGHRK